MDQLCVDFMANGVYAMKFGSIDEYKGFIEEYEKCLFENTCGFECNKIAWTNEEEITLCKGWVYVSENSRVGNTRKDARFWCEVLQYMESKTKQYGRRTYDIVNYGGRALVDYEAETGTTFKPCHCWEILKGSPKWMQNSGEASINQNVNVGNDEEEEVQYIRRPIGRDKAKDAAKKRGSRASGSSSMNDEALARLMVMEMSNQEKKERLAFLENKWK
nr:hypothetical protein [Tanacetum cinerariifolium]